MDFYTKYYQQLEGARILKFQGMQDDSPVFLVQLKDGSQVEIGISRDEEGNGGGFIDGLPHPSTTQAQR